MSGANRRKGTMKKVIYILTIVILVSVVFNFRGCLLMREKDNKVKEMEAEITKLRKDNAKFQQDTLAFQKKLDELEKTYRWAKDLLKRVRNEYSNINK